MLSDQPHPWQSAADEFHRVTLPRLKKIGKTIGQQAQQGNKLALKVIHYYSLLYKSFDPMSYLQLKEALAEYEAQTHLPS